mmetsp:Transcript_32896/g.63724  ORF Transcript_32896/g.63724 Transcript_32896/m.63724 type:complete len:412 (+) Transcript_32896:52-1287(+)
MKDMPSGKSEGDSDPLPLLLSLEIPKQLQESKSRLQNVEAAVSELQRHHEIWSGVARDGLADLWVKCNTLTEEVRCSKSKGIKQHVAGDDELCASASNDANVRKQEQEQKQDLQELRSELASESTRSKVRLAGLSQRIEETDRQLQALQNEVGRGWSNFENLEKSTESIEKSTESLKAMVTEELGRLSDTSILVDEVIDKVLQRLKAQPAATELQQDHNASCITSGSLHNAGSQADPCETRPNAIRGEMAAVLGPSSGSPFQRSRSFWLRHLQMKEQDQQQQYHLRQLQQKVVTKKPGDLEEMPYQTNARSDGDSTVTSARTATPRARDPSWTPRESVQQDTTDTIHSRVETLLSQNQDNFSRTPMQSHGCKVSTSSTSWSLFSQHAVQVRYDTPLGGRQAPPTSPRGRFR